MKYYVGPVLALVVILAGCAAPAPQSESASSSPAADQTPSQAKATKTASPTRTPTPTPSPSIFEIGAPAVHEGVELTVHAATVSPTVSRNQSNYRPGSGYETYTAVPAQEGGKYVLLQATVKNVGKESMDLTCGWPIEMKLFDSEERMFDPVDSLHEIEGNPACNAQLQPGFASEITYPFLVPADSVVNGLMFRDTNSDRTTDVSAIRLGSLS